MGTWASDLHLAYPFCNTCRFVFLCSFVCLFGMGSHILRLASNSLSCYGWPWTWVLLPLPLEWQDCRHVPHVQLDTCALPEVTLDLESIAKAVQRVYTHPSPALPTIPCVIQSGSCCSMLLRKGQNFSGRFISLLLTSCSWSRPPLGLQLQLSVHPFQISTAGCETARGAALWVGLDPASNYQVLVIGVIVTSFLLRKWVPSTCTQRPMGPMLEKVDSCLLSGSSKSDHNSARWFVG